MYNKDQMLLSSEIQLYMFYTLNSNGRKVRVCRNGHILFLNSTFSSQEPEIILDC